MPDVPADSASSDLSSGETGESRAGRSGLSGLVAQAVSLSLLQGTVLLLVGHRLRALGVALALATLLPCAVAWWRPGAWSRGLVRAALVAQLLLFARHLATTPLPYFLRLLQVSLVCAWGGVILATVFQRSGLRRDRALPLAAGLALALLLAECAIGLADTIERRQRLRGTGTPFVADVRGHPVLGYYHARDGGGRSYYPDDPRGYFLEAEEPSRHWTLKRLDGRRGRLVFGDDPARVRIESLEGAVDWETPGAPRPEGWTVRLLTGELGESLEPGRYSLRLSARADRERRIQVTLQRTAGPRDAVGFQRALDLTPEWQSFDHPFDVDRSYRGVWIELRLGGDRWPVEVRDIELVRQPDGDPVEARIHDPYFVGYDFDALGCRGPDRELPLPDGVRRILLLGDSYAFGMGVHQPDTLSSQLEGSLADTHPDARFEVVNCGVSGFSTRQERQHYEEISHRYGADVVLVTMHPNDIRSRLEEREDGSTARRRSRAEHLFHLLDRFRRLRGDAPVPDYSPNIRELVRLSEQARGRGARTVVLLFRTGEEREWEALDDAVSAGLTDLGVPVLDLGPAILAEHDPDDLWVHPLDAHPNETAHALAAREIARYLEDSGLLDD